MQPEDRDAAYLWDMVQVTHEVRDMLTNRSQQDFFDEIVLQRAVERSVEILGEIARRVSAGFQESHPEIPWRQIIGQRNILAHEYGQIDHALLYKTAVEDIPELSVKLERLLPPLD